MCIQFNGKLHLKLCQLSNYPMGVIQETPKIQDLGWVIRSHR